ALLILRLGLGTIFLGHGLQKAFGLFSGPGIKGFSGMLGSMGFWPAAFWAIIAAYTELLGGLFLILGIFPKISATLIFILIAVAILKVHFMKGLFLANGGFEYALLIACACLVLMILGAGKFSLFNEF
ncbi:DoxX family protein, partial [bacterium]